MVLSTISTVTIAYYLPLTAIAGLYGDFHPAVSRLMVLVCVAEGITALAASALCCQAVCCCRKEQV